MMLTGDSISAQEALDLGLCSRIADPDKVLEEALALARRIAENAPLAARCIKRAVNEGCEMSMDAASVLESELERYLFGTEDAVEGVTAFLEKRIPIFKGK
jgi:enoyl-CoA hydratase